MDFKEKYGPWALVTGASRGIGQAFCAELAKKQFHLVMVARNQRSLEKLAHQLEEEFHIQTLPVAVDLTTNEAFPKLLEATQGLDLGLIVNNAGISGAGPFLEQSFEQLEELLKLNAGAPLLLSHGFLQRSLKNRKHSGIILVASNAAYQSIPFLADYSASKAYLLTLGEALHWELKEKGVDVLVVCLGLTKTEGLSRSRHLDFSKFPFGFSPPEYGVRKALEALGKTSSILPHWRDRFLVFLGDRILGRKRMAKSCLWSMKKALKNSKENPASQGR